MEDRQETFNRTSWFCIWINRVWKTGGPLPQECTWKTKVCTKAVPWENTLRSNHPIGGTYRRSQNDGIQIYICSDIQVAIKEIYSARARNSLVREYEETLDLLATTKEVNQIWVRGLRGVRGNGWTPQTSNLGHLLRTQTLSGNFEATNLVPTCMGSWNSQS